MICMNQITIQTHLEENSEIDEKPISLIPSNTTVFTKEMVKQLESYQTSMGKELEKYDDWSFLIRDQLNSVKENLKNFFLMKKSEY